MKTYVAPALNSDGFNCPNCHAYAHQSWYNAAYGSKANPGTKPAAGFGAAYIYVYDLEKVTVSECQRCKKLSIWLGDHLIHPVYSPAPLPEEDMPDDVKRDFLEARDVVSISPRSAAALLRLALQKLMISLGEKGENINEDIGNLVKKGLPVRMQKSLDVVRVVGNEAVHPGEIDLRDNQQIALILFDLTNMITENMITQTKRLEEIYELIPESKKEGIKNRDKYTN